MDFKSILSKLDSMDAPIATPAAPTIAKAVQLNEDAQLRVLSGQTTYVAEAKKKKDEEVKEEMKVGDKKPSSTGGTIEKTATGVKHTAGKNYGGDKAPKDDDEDDKPAKKKAKKESIEPEFKSKFMKMVEAKKEEAADKKKGDGPKKGVNPFAKKDESVKTSKKVVAESFEPKLTFREMMKLVVESGGQQQIDAVDQELFAWAQRIAKQKLGEGMKAEVYAGMVYERMGGVFEMYDVLAEDQN